MHKNSLGPKPFVLEADQRVVDDTAALVRDHAEGSRHGRQPVDIRGGHPLYKIEGILAGPPAFYASTALSQVKA